MRLLRPASAIVSASTLGPRPSPSAPRVVPADTRAQSLYQDYSNPNGGRRASSRTHRALNTWTVLATIIILASHSNTSQAEPPVVSERTLPVHGPFAVSAAEPSITNDPARHDLPPPMPPNHGHIEPTPPDEGSPFPAGSPEAEAPVVLRRGPCPSMARSQ